MGMAARASPNLLDVAIGHAGDIVGDGACQALHGNLRPVVVWEQAGIDNQLGKQAFDHFGRVCVSAFHAGGVVKVLIKKLLGVGARLFHGRTERSQAFRVLANILERDCAAFSYPFAYFVHQVGDQGVEDTTKSLVDRRLVRSGRIKLQHGVMEAAKQGHAIANLSDGKDAGVEPVVEVCGEIGDFIGKIDELGFQGRAQIEEVFGEIRVAGSGVVAGVLDDALTHAEGQVEPRIGGIALLKPGDDAEGVQVVVKAEAVSLECAVEGFLSGVTEGRVPDVVRQCKGLGQLRVQSKSLGQSAGYLRNLKGMGQAAAEVVARRVAGKTGKNLCLSRQSAKGAGVEDARAVTRKGRAVGMRLLGVGADSEFTLSVDGNRRKQDSRRIGLRQHSKGVLAVHVWLYRSERCWRLEACHNSALNHAAEQSIDAIKEFVRLVAWTNPVIREYHPAELFEGRANGLNPICTAQIRHVWTREAEKMRTMKQVALAILALGVAFTTGCERHSNKEVFYLVTANSALPYWQTAAAGFNRAAAQYRVTAKVVGPTNYDPQAELSELQSAAAAKPAGILISVADANVLQSGIDAAVQAGIPVITIDSDDPGSHRLYFIGTNNVEAGRTGGKRLITKLGGKGNVVFFTLAGQPNIEDRLRGFKDELESRPDIHIVDVVDTKSDARVAFDKAQEMLALTGPKKIDAFVCLESASGKPVSDAIKRANLTDRVLIAWDANQDTLDGIKAGTIDSTLAQKPFTMGYYGLKALDEIFHAPPTQLNKDYSADPFSPYPVFVDTGTSLVDKDNVDLYIASAAQAK